jgi:hypothetical protein
VGARADAAAGLDPGLAYGATVYLTLERRELSVGLEFRVLAPSSLDVGRGSLRVWQWALLLAPCAHGGGFLGCLVGSAGMVYGRGQGFAINDQSSSPTAAAGARAGWEYPLFGEQLRLRRPQPQKQTRHRVSGANRGLDICGIEWIHGGLRRSQRRWLRRHRLRHGRL